MAVRRTEAFKARGRAVNLKPAIIPQIVADVSEVNGVLNFNIQTSLPYAKVPQSLLDRNPSLKLENIKIEPAVLKMKIDFDMIPLVAALFYYFLKQNFATVDKLKEKEFIKFKRANDEITLAFSKTAATMIVSRYNGNYKNPVFNRGVIILSSARAYALGKLILKGLLKKERVIRFNLPAKREGYYEGAVEITSREALFELPQLLIKKKINRTKFFELESAFASYVLSQGIGFTIGQVQKLKFHQKGFELAGKKVFVDPVRAMLIKESLNIIESLN